MSKPDGGPAFPSTHGTANVINAEGMTLRDYFAAAALTGLLAQSSNQDIQKAIGKACSQAGILPENAFAKIAFGNADAMLKERTK